MDVKSTALQQTKLMTGLLLAVDASKPRFISSTGRFFSKNSREDCGYGLRLARNGQTPKLGFLGRVYFNLGQSGRSFTN